MEGVSESTSLPHDPQVAAAEGTAVVEVEVDIMVVAAAMEVAKEAMEEAAMAAAADITNQVVAVTAKADMVAVVTRPSARPESGIP